ncbi:glycosyltransferase involved in cell wall biosynthesis [Halarchaeum rubridurum]|uniref:Glycosyl transferase family 1 n=1 Tax=Halarchaeum rubridurum TaxID=489911 RepID=A0A830G231_9EURY|nr:glycosyltransferase [Halarchaeum rubridurum]MBP1955313.1 glycosyltransferase involved in cell wall biosynthesis [Halarchaeum rubridurum]GGM71330.1 glycosyl transferase family 1 [Halarchaeum rubridurum]
MRVALVSDRTVHHDDGEERRTADDALARLDTLVSTLDADGHDVEVFCARWWDGGFPSFDYDGVTYRAIAATPGERRGTLRLVRALRAFDPDVVHVAGATPERTLGARVATAFGAPVVLDYYDPPDGSRADRLALRAADGVVVPSEHVATAARECSASDDALARIPNPVEMARVRAVEPDPEAGDVVYSRRLDDAANLESLLLALAEFREYEWSATVIGDGPERESYERQARDLRIADRIDFVGARGLDDRLALFAGAHVYAQTATRTSFPTDLLRALACGCVGVVEYHANSAAHELVEHADRGLLATSDAALVERLREATAMERASVDEAYAEYDVGRFRARHIEYYRSL